MTEAQVLAHSLGIWHRLSKVPKCRPVMVTESPIRNLESYSDLCSWGNVPWEAYLARTEQITLLPEPATVSYARRCRYTWASDLCQAAATSILPVLAGRPVLAFGRKVFRALGCGRGKAWDPYVPYESRCPCGCKAVLQFIAMPDPRGLCGPQVSHEARAKAGAFFSRVVNVRQLMATSN